MMHGGDVWQGGAPEDWLDFSANLRPGGPPAWLREALSEAVAQAAYYPDPRMARARAALGSFLGLDADRVLPTAGGIAAIGLAAQLPAPAQFCFSPCFGEYAAAVARRGGSLQLLPLLAGRNELRSPSACLPERLPRGAALWLCNPLNPLGTAFDRAEIAALLARVEAVQGFLILDEAFIHCCPQRTSVGLLAQHPRLVILGSLTKLLGIPGVRAGYLCAGPKLLAELARNLPPWELSCFAEAAICALPAHAAELREEAEGNARRREELRRGLEWLGARVFPSEANFLLADFGRPVEALVARLRERGILLRSCMDFPGLDDGCHLRIAVRDEAANERLLRETEAILCAESH